VNARRRYGAEATAITRRTGEQGSAAVEFALVLPLVLLLTLALLQVGLLVKDQLVLVEAARAGAREASVTIDDAQARRAASDAAVSLDPDRIDVSVRRDGGTGTATRVEVTYHAVISVPLISWLFPSAIELRASAVMRQEVE
jgi:Flp pilus assembly protein TadG